MKSDEKPTVMKSLSIYFGHRSLTFLNSFLKILNEYNVFILNKYNLNKEYAFVLAIFGGRGLM